MVDTAFIARLGTDALAALGVGTMLLSALFWGFSFLGIAVQTQIGTLYGKSQQVRKAADEAARLSVLAMTLGLLIGLVLCVMGVLLAPAAVRVMGAEGDLLTMAVVYVRLRMIGAPAILIGLAAFGALRGAQDMRRPLLIAAGINGLNILLDAVLIFGFAGIPALGVAGAALASAISQWIGAFWVVAAVVKRFGLPEALDWGLARRVLAPGGNLFLRAAFLNALLVLGTRQATLIGPGAGAVHQVIRSAWIFTALFLDAFAISGQSLVAFFIGTGKISRARHVAWVVCIWSLATGALLGAGMLLSQSWMQKIYIPSEAAALFVIPWWIAAFSQPLNGLTFATDGIHWGSGDYRYLRNAVLVALLPGALIILLTDVTSPSALIQVWCAIVLWTSIRALAGILRIWPGWGAAPLANTV